MINDVDAAFLYMCINIYIYIFLCVCVCGTYLHTRMYAGTVYCVIVSNSYSSQDHANASSSLPRRQDRLFAFMFTLRCQFAERTILQVRLGQNRPDGGSFPLPLWLWWSPKETKNSLVVCLDTCTFPAALQCDVLPHHQSHSWRPGKPWKTGNWGT